MVNANGLVKLTRPLILLGNSGRPAEKRGQSAGDDPPRRHQSAARSYRSRRRASEQPFKERGPGRKRGAGREGVVAGEIDAGGQTAGRTAIARLRMRDHV